MINYLSKGEMKKGKREEDGVKGILLSPIMMDSLNLPTVDPIDRSDADRSVYHVRRENFQSPRIKDREWISR